MSESRTPRICVATGNPCGTDSVTEQWQCPRGGKCVWAGKMEAMVNHAFAEYGYIGDRPKAMELRAAISELESDLAAARAEVERLRKDAERYSKLRGWMSSNVSEGWNEVQKLASIACYLSWDDFDRALDSLGQCDVGLMHRAEYVPISEEPT